MKRTGVHFSEDSLRTGIDFLDNEHRVLFTMFAELRSRSGTDTETEAVADVLERLWRLINSHFDLEESILAKIDETGLVYTRHSLAHNALLKQYMGLVARMNKGEKSVPQEMADFLGNWLTEHIVIHDIKIRDVLASMGQGSNLSMTDVLNRKTAEPSGQLHLVLDKDVVPCPQCISAMQRISRHPLMRLLPGSKLYWCTDCNKRYLVFRGKPFRI